MTAGPSQDVHTICVLGQGAFGKVALVRYLGRQYALKQLWKSHVIKMGVQEHVKREAKILMSCKNDFLVNLVATGKSEDKLFMLMNPVLGGELFTYLRVRPGTSGRDVMGGEGAWWGRNTCLQMSDHGSITSTCRP